MDPSPSRTPGATRAAVIEAGLRRFGRQGFDATTTREIAALAGTNIASISYHFGGKEGLRTACAEHVVALIRKVTEGPDAEVAATLDPQAARAVLAQLVGRMIRFLLLEPDAGVIAGFVVREMVQPSTALDTIYAGVFERVHRRACALWGAATLQEAESEAVRLAVFASIGQVVYFHLGRPVVLRRMDWPAIGPAEAEAITATVTKSLLARLDADRGAQP